MYPKSSYVGYPRSPLSSWPLSMPCYFLRHTSGSKFFPGGRVLLHLNSNAGLHPRCLLQPSSNAGLYPRCYLGNEKVEGGYPSLTPKKFSMEPATRSRVLCRTASEVVHHLGLGLIFCEYFFSTGAIYSLPRYIASSPQGMCRPKIRDAPEG